MIIHMYNMFSIRRARTTRRVWWPSTEIVHGECTESVVAPHSPSKDENIAAWAGRGAKCLPLRRNGSHPEQHNNQFGSTFFLNRTQPAYIIFILSRQLPEPSKKILYVLLAMIMADKCHHLFRHRAYRATSCADIAMIVFSLVRPGIVVLEWQFLVRRLCRKVRIDSVLSRYCVLEPIRRPGHHTEIHRWCHRESHRRMDTRCDVAAHG